VEEFFRALGRRALAPVVRISRLVQEQSLLIDAAAAVLGLSRRTVYYRIREGRLRTIRTKGGSQRVLLSSIEELRREIRDARARRTWRAYYDPHRQDLVKRAPVGSMP
jgi:excisionase family DNA binding protein